MKTAGWIALACAGAWLAGCDAGNPGPAPGSASASAPGSTIIVTVNPAVTHPISPYIYGINFAAKVAGLPSALTCDRVGGNRLTTYNWVTNASNAGSDWSYQNDNYLSSSASPAEAITSFIAKDQAAGMATIVTFQMQGLVAGDARGPVSVANPPDRTRFNTVVFQKKLVSDVPFTASPPPGEETVYMDEFIWALDQKFAGQHIFAPAPSSQRVFAELDNEPELWNSTHLEVQGSIRVPADRYIAKTVSLAGALKAQFPDVVIFGPAHYGFYGIYAWNGEFKPTPAGNDWFTDRYLSAIRTASLRFGRPLVDVYDFHWYPEVKDENGKRITTLTGPALTDAQVQAIVQSPRSLWDKSYTENSWITQALGQPAAILGRLQSRITAENPGMRLAITEYNNGGAQHIAGTLAQADSLGIFGVQDLFAANLWLLTADEPFVLAGFRAFRNFDGANHHFGDTSVQATSSNVGNVAAYVSTDSTRPGRVVIVAINRSMSAQQTTFVGQPLSGAAHLYRMSAATQKTQGTLTPAAAGVEAVQKSSLTLTLPPMSVTSVDIY